MTEGEKNPGDPDPAEPGFALDSEAYNRDLARGLSLSGEGRDYFARGRVAALRKRLGTSAGSVGELLDFGCGDGSSTPWLHSGLGAQRITGVDRSDELLDAARAEHGGGAHRFLRDGELPAEEAFDGAFCNGVFHHLSPAEQVAAIHYVHQRLRPGGWFALCENNPWNPGTRWVMSRIEFDRDAIPITAPRVRALLVAAGFDVQGTDYLFFFPRPLAWLRSIEPALRAIPLGAQYMVLARK